eukprot:s133_g6.t1
MATSGGDTTSRSKDGVPQWDGNSATFQRYEEESLLWQEGIAYHKRYMAGPRLVAELQGAAKRMVAGKPAGWVSYQGGVEALMSHLRQCLGKPQIAEMTDYLNLYFRNSRRRSGETINEYVTRKSELYMRAQQALNRLLPHQAPMTAGSGQAAASYQHQRRSSWTSEATATTTADDGELDEAATETTTTEPEGRWGPQNYQAYGGWSWWNSDSQWSSPNWTWSTGRSNWEPHAWWTGGRRTEAKGVELLPDWVQGWYMLQDANLTTGERNLIYTALKGDFGVTKVAQELRNQWPEQDLKRRDQHYKSSGFLGEGPEDDYDEGDEAWATVEYEEDELLGDEGSALVAEAEDEARQAWAAIQAGRRTLREARQKQHQVRMSRKYYNTASGSSGANGRVRDDSKLTCLGCGNMGHRIANCPNPQQKAHSAEKQAAPFVCYAEQALVGGVHDGNHGGPTTAEAVEAGMGVIDGGATRTLGSVRAIEAIMRVYNSKTGESGVRSVDLQDRPVFGFADSGEAQCVSTINLDLLANGQNGKLKIHALNKGAGPVLVSIATLSTSPRTYLYYAN